MFKKDKCVLKQMCAYKPKNYISNFTLFHHCQSNDNVYTKTNYLQMERFRFHLCKKRLCIGYTQLTIEIDILCNVKLCKHVLRLNGI